jgi:hypothetical protein
VNEEEAKKWRERGDSEEEIADKSRQEYDARVVEGLVYSKLNEFLTIEDWANVVKSQLLDSEGLH